MTRPTLRVVSLPAAPLSLTALNWPPRPAARPNDATTAAPSAPSAERLSGLRERVDQLLAEIGDLERQASGAAPTTVSASLITLMGKLRRGELTADERARVVTEIAEYERRQQAASETSDTMSAAERIRIGGKLRRAEPLTEAEREQLEKL